MPEPKRLPLRKCLGCGEMKPKRELVRVVRSPEGAIALDRTGKAPGRGAYLCIDPDCFKKAKKAKRLQKVFACAVDPEIYDELAMFVMRDV